MKWPHLLRVEAPAGDFAELLAACREQGLRVGWLELAAVAAPAPLAAAAGLGVLRAVAVGGGRSLALKPLRGEAVLRDLVREHFLGCRLVLVAGGDGELPLLERRGAGWRVTGPGGAARELATPELVRALRAPRPFGRQRPESERG